MNIVHWPDCPGGAACRCVESRSILVVGTITERSPFIAGRKLVIDNGEVTPIADDATGAVEYRVCPRLDEQCSTPPFDIGSCTECGAEITFRDTPRSRAMLTPTAKKICRPCIIKLSRE